MAVREYVGARYVPNFTGLYDNTRIYDALDVVDNGSGTSYIARKTVPAGTPLTDTEYWFVYGASSGAIIDLQNRMSAAETNINNNTTDIAKTRRNHKGRRVIVISDSYGSDEAQFSGYSFFQFLQASLQEAEFNELFTGYLDGASFGWSSKLYLSVLQGMTITNPETITDILIVGGFNDLCNYVSSGICTLTDIYNGIQNFMDYVHTNYPYAETTFIPVGMKGGDNPGVKRLEIAANLPIIKTYCDGSGMGICCNAINTLRFTGSQIADDTHPSEAGQRAISRAVSEYLFTGNIDIRDFYSLDPGDITLASDITSVNSIQWYETINNECVFLESVQIRLNCNGITIPTLNNGGLTIFTFKPTVKHFIHDNSQLSSPMIPSVFRSANTNLPANVAVRIENGAVKIGTLDDTPISPIYDLILRFGSKVYNTLFS